MRTHYTDSLAGGVEVSRVDGKFDLRRANPETRQSPVF
jgi:hypothetical protein